jgi:hypothetical protein
MKPRHDVPAHFDQRGETSSETESLPCHAFLSLVRAKGTVKPMPPLPAHFGQRGERPCETE